MALRGIAGTMATTQQNRLEAPLQRQFGLLVFQFLLGMAVNLIGLPDELHAGLAKTSDQLLLALHVLLALGLLINAIIIMRLAGEAAKRGQGLSRGAGAAIGVAIVAGLLTMSAPGSNWWSYLMAVAFVAAFALYGRLFWEIKTDGRSA
jgi:hypothetical protein